MKEVLAESTLQRGPGRPRSEEARKAVLQGTLELLQSAGFNELSIESIAAHAGVGKATVYRWWPNKAALVVDAFLSVTEDSLRFPPAGPAQQTIREQMKRWTAVFRGPLGQIIAAVIGAGQSEPEILQAVREHWIEPRRREARELLRHGMENGEIRLDLDPDTILDLLYGPLYLRLLLQNAPLTPEFVDTLFEVMEAGLRPRVE